MGDPLIQRVQCTVGVRVTVQALHKQFPSLLRRRFRIAALPFLPGLGVGGPLAVFCLSCFVSPSAVLTAVQPHLGPCLWVVRDCLDLGKSDAWPRAPFPAGNGDGAGERSLFMSTPAWARDLIVPS